MSPCYTKQGITTLDCIAPLCRQRTSLTVQSGYRFIRQATGSGRAVAVVNRGTTRAHEVAALTIDGDCSEVLALVDAAL